MEDLDDHMLTQILLRLPNCATVLSCSPVNKRWHSLISERSFKNLFTNHKKKATTHSKGLGSDIDEPPWTIVKTMLPIQPPGPIRYDNINTLRPITEFIIGPPKLSLKYLPSNIFTVSATFKDLVFCRSGRIYYITNPLTKQWVVLPSCPRVKDRWNKTSTALICQPPCNHTQDYKYRVVEVRLPVIYIDQGIDTIELVVYCSEIDEWKEIKLRFPKEAGPLLAKPQIVVCNGIIYFRSGLCLLALDPFDVNDACDKTLEARVMPPLPELGYLLESSGQLFIVHTPNNIQGEPCLLYKTDGTAIELEMVVSKLDLNQAPLAWETTFKGLCKGTGYKTEPPRNPELGITRSIYGDQIVVHPYNDKLIYMHLSRGNQFVLCNTQTGCITPLKSLSNYHVHISYPFCRLEHQWWPTLVPPRTMPHSRAEFATTTAS